MCEPKSLTGDFYRYFKKCNSLKVTVATKFVFSIFITKEILKRDDFYLGDFFTVTFHKFNLLKVT